MGIPLNLFAAFSSTAAWGEDTAAAPAAGTSGSDSSQAALQALVGVEPRAQREALRRSNPYGDRVATAAATAIPGLENAPPEVRAFLGRVFENLPKADPAAYYFKSWSVAGKATQEGVGLLPISGVSADKLASRVMDVDHYVGNIDHVLECRSIVDSRFARPKQVRFYQQLNIPIIADMQHELVLVDAGEVHGYRVVYWYMLKPETRALNRDKGARSEYSVGAWFSKPGFVGYALSDAPIRDDVNWLQWQALTTGADVLAKTVIGDNIKGMAAWAKK